MLLLPAAALRTPIFLVAILASAGALVQSQSLGEAAAKEKERRAKIQGSGQSFGDSELQEARVGAIRRGRPERRRSNTC